MWRPIKLVIKNFRTFIDQEINFKPDAVLLQGLNLTDEGQESNGSGKSSIREAICFVLDLPVFADIATDLINYKAGYCTVSISFKNEVLGGLLDITRTVPIKGSGTLTIKLNNEDQKARFSTVPEGNKLIFEILGVSKDDLISYFILSKEKFKSFFRSSDADVKELIGRFSNFDRINGVDSIITKDLKSKETEISKHQSEIDKLIGKIELLNEEKQELDNRDEEETRDKIINGILDKRREYEKLIDNLSGEISSIEEDISELKKSMDAQDSENTLQKQDLKALEVSLKSLRDTKKSLDEKMESDNKNLLEYTETKNNIDLMLAGVIECPECHHNFIPNVDMDINEAKLLLPDLVSEINRIKNLINLGVSGLSRCSQQIKDINFSIDSLSSRISRTTLSIAKVDGNISRKELDIKNKQESIEQYELLIGECDESIVAARTEPLDKGRSEEIAKKTEEAEESLRKKEEEAREATKEAEKLKVWTERFGKFRSFLANHSLSIIEGYTNLFLGKMKSNLTVRLEGFKVLKDGKVRDKITPSIMRDGNLERSGGYKKFSSGERARVDFAVIMALQALINNASPTGGVDLLFVDEIMDSLDVKGLELLAGSVSGMDKTIIIVSHVLHGRGGDNIMTVEKQNGISRII